jgi:hypothetical protein
MKMAFTDRQVEYPNRFYLTDENGNQTGPFTLTRAEGEVIEEGTPLTAENLNTEISETANSAAAAAVATFNSAFTIDSSNNVGFRNLQSGTVVVKVKKAKTTYKAAVKFPKAFTKRPNVIACPWSGAPAACQVSVSDVTTTGFNVYFYRTTKADTTVFWMAFV